MHVSISPLGVRGVGGCQDTPDTSDIWHIAERCLKIREGVNNLLSSPMWGRLGGGMLLVNGSFMTASFYLCLECGGGEC